MVLGGAGWLMSTGPIAAVPDSSPDIGGAQMAVLGRKTNVRPVTACRTAVRRLNVDGVAASEEGT